MLLGNYKLEQELDLHLINNSVEYVLDKPLLLIRLIISQCLIMQLVVFVLADAEVSIVLLIIVKPNLSSVVILELIAALVVTVILHVAVIFPISALEVLYVQTLAEPNVVLVVEAGMLVLQVQLILLVAMEQLEEKQEHKMFVPFLLLLHLAM
jgi:hypothetical protein